MRGSPPTLEVVENILRLRRVESRADGALRDDAAAVREFLESLVGPTVRPADAARLLGLSHPALLRWMNKDEIATVYTPTGRREIPLGELLSLLEDVERVGSKPTSRPVARAVKERRRASEETADLDRLVPRSRRRGHGAAELQALAYHRLVAERLDERLVDQARRRLRRWRREGRVDPRWIDDWEHVLEQPLAKIKRRISANTVKARELRQTSPFAGVLSEHERRRLARAVQERVTA